MTKKSKSAQIAHVWEKPELRRLNAADAETAVGPGLDAVNLS